MCHTNLKRTSFGNERVRFIITVQGHPNAILIICSRSYLKFQDLILNNLHVSEIALVTLMAAGLSAKKSFLRILSVNVAFLSSSLLLVKCLIHFVVGMTLQITPDCQIMAGIIYFNTLNIYFLQIIQPKFGR